MDVLPMILFLLGVGFLFLGWRWQNKPNEETLTALKGLAYLKKEIVRVQDQVIDLEGKLLESKEREFQEVIQREILLREKETNVLELGKPNGSSQLSPKCQEVLELAAGGDRIPDIAQRLFISQDAVSMILRMRPNGGNNT